MVPAGQSVRPMQDFLREALFSILSDRLLGAVVMDCFAGTGSVGLEALSRGAEQCYFLEKHPRTIAILQSNIHRCGVESQAIIIKGDWSRVAISHKVIGKIHVAFFDPPFAADHVRIVHELVGHANLFRDAILVYRFPTGRDPFSQAPMLDVFDRRRYGGSELSFFTFRKTGIDGFQGPEDLA